MIYSDGGAKNTTGSYGAAIANLDTVLVAILGRAFGFKPGSFRAESYGMLASLRYIYHCISYYNIDFKSKTFIFCDNKGLLLRIETHDIKQKPSPRQFLYSEIDIEMQIIDTIKAIKMREIQFTHVLGHQDNNTPFDELPWPVKMNVYCD